MKKTEEEPGYVKQQKRSEDNEESEKYYLSKMLEEKTLQANTIIRILMPLNKMENF